MRDHALNGGNAQIAVVARRLGEGAVPHPFLPFAVGSVRENSAVTGRSDEAGENARSGVAS